MPALPEHPWGRVEEDGTVYVIDNGAERSVGQYPDGTPEEALAYFVRKYGDLEAQVALLEQRVRMGAPAADISRSAGHLAAQLAEANAVGDLAALRSRVEAIGGSAAELGEQQHEAARAELAEALARREQIVAEAERLAAQPPAQIQWKRTTAAIEELFARWQQHQQEGPRLPKGEANALWKRFRQARSTLDAERRAFFAELDAAHKQAREAKNRIIERAEALAPQGADGVPEYRRLLDEWKAAGRAGRKHDDALWNRFKAAGDVLFQAKNAIEAQTNEEFQANLERKEALLDEAAPIMEMSDRVKARAALSDVQRRWDDIGRVPRDRLKQIEDRLRRIEQHVRKLDEDHWERSNPEKRARSENMHAQLTEAIERLEAELASAQASGDEGAARKAQEALQARRDWLAALGG